MPQHKMVMIEVLRPYPRGKTTHRPGSRIPVPEYAVESITGANPPFGKVVKETKAEEKKVAEAKAAEEKK